MGWIVVGLCFVMGLARDVRAETKVWPKQMQELKTVLFDLTVDLSSQDEFFSKKNSSRIGKNIKQLSKLTHEIKKGEVMAPDSDPSLPILSGILSRETARANDEWVAGNKEYARSVLKTVTQYCFACHSRNQVGPSFSGTVDEKALQNLKRLEKADFYSAVREYDKALAQYIEIVKDPKAGESRILEWEAALTRAMALSVRVKKDPALALGILDVVEASPYSPEFIKSLAKGWRKSTLEWKSESARSLQSSEGYKAESTRLFAKGRNQQQYPADRSGEIEYLRASALVHDWLALGLKGNNLSDALFMAGLSYDALQDLGIWSLHEVYYEMCVTQSPGTDIAKKCFNRLEESLYLGYTGSSGTHLPQGVKRFLDELKSIANGKKS